MDVKAVAPLATPVSWVGICHVLPARHFAGLDPGKGLLPGRRIEDYPVSAQERALLAQWGIRATRPSEQPHVASAEHRPRSRARHRRAF